MENVRFNGRLLGMLYRGHPNLDGGRGTTVRMITHPFQVKMLLIR